MRICYIFRNSRAGYSIKKVFDTFIPYIKNKRVVELPTHRANPISVVQNLFYLLQRKEKKCLYHITGNVEYCALVLPPKRTILTIHDMVLINHNDVNKIKKLFFYYVWYKWPLKRAALVTCISQKTKNELLDYFPWVADKTIVIPNPVSSDIVYKKNEESMQNPIILHIGTRENKNLERVILALSGIECRLRIIGDLSEQQMNLLSQQKINYSTASNLTDAEIAQEYAHCDLVSFPSTYEGFGMPIIEGFASGRVVITSNIEPMRDVSNGKAILVNPYSVESIRKGFLIAIKSFELRQNLINGGLREAEKYAPGKIAQQYESYYRKIKANQE